MSVARQIAKKPSKLEQQKALLGGAVPAVETKPQALPANINIANARLPHSYEAAKTALANCVSIDECVDWADKAAALASYAKQADDKTLLSHATRIRDRAVRRAGELLKQIEPAHGANQNNGAAADTKVLTRKDAAKQAGMSKRQAVTAIRVASVPTEAFERQVESANPPTVTKLAEQGKKPAPTPTKPAPVRPEGFKEATNLIGTVERFAQFCAAQAPEIIAAAVMPHEVKEVREHVATIDAWLDRFVVNLKG